MTEIKTKDKGDIKRTGFATANGIQFLNGDIQRKHAKVPIILMDYLPPPTAEPFAQGERFAMWLKLEDAQYKEIVRQLNPNLREITLWFNKTERERLKEFLNMEDKK